MTDTTAAPASTVAEFEFPHFTGKLSFDCADVPADTRLEFLKNAIRAYIANRLNAAHSRHLKDPAAASWVAYEEASKADPLQTLVAQPTTAKPADPDYMDVYNRAVADLKAGAVRRQGDTPKARKAKDPLVSVVTDVVVRAVYDSQRAVDPKYTFFKARAAVGPDGIAYLNAAIESKVAAAPEAEQAALRSQLEKSRDAKYINPAKAMLGLNTGKKDDGLPSIL